MVGTQTELGTLGDGNAYLYLGRSGGAALLLTPTVVPIPGGPNGGFGYVLGGAGDLNADGFGDFAIGAIG